MPKLTANQFCVTVCCGCRKVMTADQEWAEGEDLLEILPAKYLSHSMCPTCAEKFYPDFVVKRKPGPTAS